ncbi:MAG: LysE family transporter [Reichenbachiella sp.]|uniref:LysE family translocator n=1 Tax=Reichenbachiella sp. TaxID=2184521 RepID=UPI0032659565
MSLIALFFFAFFFSFIGSIPPGSINITTLQYALEGRRNAGLSFALASALTEYLYAGIAVRFQIYLTSNESISQYFSIITGTVLLILGIYNLLKKPTQNLTTTIGERRHAFKKGVLISLANPLAIPFWLMVTIYLQSMGWVELTDQNFWIYVAGVSTGTFVLLAAVIQLGSKFAAIQGNTFIIYKLPGLIFIAMGLWSFIQ